jgi:hypothetical protein
LRLCENLSLTAGPTQRNLSQRRKVRKDEPAKARLDKLQLV